METRNTLVFPIIIFGWLWTYVYSQAYSAQYIDSLAKSTWPTILQMFPDNGAPYPNSLTPRGPYPTVEPHSPAWKLALFTAVQHNATQIGKQALLVEQISRILIRNNKIAPQDVAAYLASINVDGTFLSNICEAPLIDELRPGLPLATYCLQARYRTMDGSCNNLLVPSLGKSFTRFKRFLPPDYADGLSFPRVSYDGQPLPSPRLVSSRVILDRNVPHPRWSHLFMQFGQFIDHDLTATPTWRSTGGQAPRCCGVKEVTFPECLPILVPQDDYFAQNYGQQCMEFVRSVSAPRANCALGPREQMNQITAYLDGSGIYGASPEDAKQLIDFRTGKLRSEYSSYRNGHMDNLPRTTPGSKCPYNSDAYECWYRAGDNRLNVLPTLASLHVIWFREHNRVVDALKVVNPCWDAETLFQESRRIVSAELQHIVYNEFLSILLGNDYAKWDVVPLKTGYYNGYNPHVDPSIANVFATAAYRFGHSMIQRTIDMFDCNYRQVNQIPDYISDFFFKVANMSDPEIVGNYIRGMLMDHAQDTDNYLTWEVTRFLFKSHNSKYPDGLDLASLNINRGREHGIPGYNYWREWCQIGRARSFKDLENTITPERIKLLVSVYKHVDDIDLWVGGLMENIVGAVGPTFACIIGRQFENIRRGDRFWYENPKNEKTKLYEDFTAGQLQEIRKASLSRIICDNTENMKTIQVQSLLVESPENRRVPCQQIPIVNLNTFAQCRPAGPTGAYGQPPVFLPVQQPQPNYAPINPFMGKSQALNYGMNILPRENNMPY